MIEKHIATLNKLRNNDIGIEDFFYKRTVDDGGNDYDANARKRYCLLMALLYDWSPADEELIRKLFEQEITVHQEATCQGLAPALGLNAYLLSRFKNPENVWLFTTAKEANFDTFCGFDYEYLVSAGIEETFDLVDRSHCELKERFYHIAGETASTCNITIDHLKEWEGGLPIFYDTTRDSLEDQIQLADDLGEHAILREKISQWKDGEHIWNKQELNRLIHYEGLLKNIDGQILGYEKLIAMETDDWTKCSLLDIVCELYLGVGRVDSAWEKIKLAQRHLKNIPDWRKAGLGRFIIENTFAIVLAFNDPNNPEAKAAYSWASQEVKGMDNLYSNLLDKAARAAALMGDRQK